MLIKDLKVNNYYDTTIGKDTYYMYITHITVSKGIYEITLEYYNHNTNGVWQTTDWQGYNSIAWIYCSTSNLLAGGIPRAPSDPSQTVSVSVFGNAGLKPGNLTTILSPAPRPSVSAATPTGLIPASTPAQPLVLTTKDLMPGKYYEDKAVNVFFVISSEQDVDPERLKVGIDAFDLVGGRWNKSSYPYLKEYDFSAWTCIPPPGCLSPYDKSAVGATAPSASNKVAIPDNAKSKDCLKCNQPNKVVVLFQGSCYWCPNCEP